MIEFQNQNIKSQTYLIVNIIPYIFNFYKIRAKSKILQSTFKKHYNHFIPSIYSKDMPLQLHQTSKKPTHHKYYFYRNCFFYILHTALASCIVSLSSFFAFCIFFIVSIVNNNSNNSVLISQVFCLGCTYGDISFIFLRLVQPQIGTCTKFNTVQF